MTHVLNTSRMPTEDRAEMVRDVIAKTMVHVGIDFAGGDREAGAHGVITDVGDVRICSVRSNAVALERTERLARDAQEPTIFLAVQPPRSRLGIEQDGKQMALEPGQLAFCDSSAAYSLRDPNGIKQHFFGIKVASLGLPVDLVNQLRAVPLCPSHPVADLSAAYFTRLATRPDIAALPDAGVLGQPSIELVRALVSTHLDATSRAKDALHKTLLLRVLEYTRSHLHEPQLSAAQIAAEHHISVRHLYNVLARSDISLGDWIRTQRLEACRADLLRPEWRHLTIAAVARKNGFADPSTFGRLFRSAFGLAPREWREQGISRN